MKYVAVGLKEQRIEVFSSPGADVLVGGGEEEVALPKKMFTLDCASLCLMRSNGNPTLVLRPGCRGLSATLVTFFALAAVTVSAAGQQRFGPDALGEPASGAIAQIPLSGQVDRDPTASVDAESMLQRAKDDLRRSDFLEAEHTLRHYLRLQPGSAEGLYLLGEVLMRRDQPKESLGVFTQAAAIRKPTGKELRLVGLDYALLLDYVDAIRWFQTAVELSPEDADSWYSLGRAQYSNGNYHGAVDSFEKTLTLDGRSVKAENNLGLAFAALNKPEKALEAYRMAVAFQANSAVQSEQPLLNLGSLLLDRGQAQEAADALEKAASLDPKCAACFEAWGKALGALNRFGEAKTAMEKAVALEPTNPRFHFVLGQMYKRTGDTQLSRAELQKSAELYGSHSTPTQ